MRVSGDMLKSDLTKILGREPNQDEICFKMIFLLDDFSATGMTYLIENEKAVVHYRLPMPPDGKRRQKLEVLPIDTLG